MCNELKPLHGHGMCDRCYSKQYDKDHREKIKQYRKDHREESKQYREDHRDKLLLKKRQYYKLHQDELRIKDQQRRESEPEYGRSKTNKDCPAYLGCTIAETVLSHVFKNVEIMPIQNPGFDFICGKGFKIDVKSSCRYKRKKRQDSWRFNIRYNMTADYFLCLAFDNRQDLNPEHIWLIPSVNVNDKSGITITESKLNNWSKYELHRLNDIITYCNTMKGDNND